MANLILENYDHERNFLDQNGEISMIESGENAELLNLVGFFSAFYFLWRRRKATAMRTVVG